MLSRRTFSRVTLTLLMEAASPNATNSAPPPLMPSPVPPQYDPVQSSTTELFVKVQFCSETSMSLAFPWSPVVRRKGRNAEYHYSYKQDRRHDATPRNSMEHSGTCDGGLTVAAQAESNSTLHAPARKTDTAPPPSPSAPKLYPSSYALFVSPNTVLP